MQKPFTMNKSILTAAVLIVSTAVSARTIKLTMSDYFTENTQKNTFVVTDADKGVTLTAGKGTFGAQSGYFAGGGDVRVQFGATLKVETTDPNITKIEFILSSQGKERLPELSADKGTATVSNDPDYSAVWSGNASSVTFTVGANNYGSNPKERGQLCFTAIRITTDGTGSDADDTPDLNKNYTFTQGRARYYGTKYSTYNNFLFEIYSDGISFAYDSEFGETIEGTGAYAVFDIYTQNGQTFIGNYTSAQGTKPNGLATGNASSSLWHVCGRGNCVDAYMQNGSITISCTPSGKYNVTYDITDTEGNRHNGTVYGLNMAVTQENGSSYTVHNQCTDADGTGLTAAKNIDGLFVRGTNIVVELDTPTDIAVYTILGQKIGATYHATTYQLNVSSGLYIVQMGNKATKIVVR